VITGASSGLGRATALALAPFHCRLVLAARRVEDLEDTALACRERGAQAIVVGTDVTKERDVSRLVDTALGHFGVIDVWINNAGVTLFAPLEEAPFEEHRRVIETNLFGAMLGARAVLPLFRRQGRGTIINVGSVLSEIGQAFVPSYVISKFGLRGMSEALRAEVADEPDIHICSIFPYAIDTPHFQSGANRVAKEAHAMPPVQSPEKVAAAIVQLIARPRRELHIPRYTVLGLALHRLAPRTTERLLLRALQRYHLTGAQPPTDGNLYTPSAEPGQVHGERPPELGGAALMGWTARELLRIVAEDARRQVRALTRRVSRPRASDAAASSTNAASPPTNGAAPPTNGAPGPAPSPAAS
jgi:short-subunit dehydrogenase